MWIPSTYSLKYGVLVLMANEKFEKGKKFANRKQDTPRHVPILTLYMQNQLFISDVKRDYILPLRAYGTL